MIREIEDLRREEEIVLLNARDREERDRYVWFYLEERLRIVETHDAPPPPYTEREDRPPSYGCLTPPYTEREGEEGK